MWLVFLQTTDEGIFVINLLLASKRFLEAAGVNSWIFTTLIGIGYREEDGDDKNISVSYEEEDSDNENISVSCKERGGDENISDCLADILADSSASSWDVGRLVMRSIFSLLIWGSE